MKDKPEWAKDMEKAMADIVAACNKNDSWTACRPNCPFTTICDLCMEVGIGAPDSWTLTEKNSQKFHVS